MTLLSSDAWPRPLGPWSTERCQLGHHIQCSKWNLCIPFSFSVHLSPSLSLSHTLFPGKKSLVHSVIFTSKESYFSACCTVSLLNGFSEWDLNVPGFSKRLIFTMGNNNKKFTLVVLLNPDVMYHPAPGEAFMKPGITVREDTLGAVKTFIFVAGMLSG